KSVPALYARAYAWHKAAYPDKALAEANSLIANNPNDPYFLELKGQILLESGRPAEALAPLRRATELSGYHPLIATTFGHALIATENPQELDEAERMLRAAVSRDRENPFAWYQLGVIYGMKGDIPRAQLASAEQQVLQLNYFAAERSAAMAQASLPKGSPDWIRAGDIAMQARAAIEQQKKRR
ncbi:MAG: tetratricopeptide repeat protein, partial [Sphingomonadales bacterium]|nr:tetratricopeptide repeat protein [Sphingomonadales bacterium]